MAQCRSEVSGSPPASEPRRTGPVATAFVRDLGRRAYVPVWRAMQRFTDARDADTPDELWLVEHDPVFTLGQAGKPEHVLMPGDIPVLQVDRGGQVTYHGPGQIVLYPLLDLKRLRIGVRDYVCGIEQAVIDTLGEWNILGVRREGAPGVYVDGAKIAALGIRVRRGCTFHGLAFNIAMDLSPFHRINPCGYAGLQVTSMLDLGGPSGLDAVKPVLLAALARQFGLDPVTAAAPDLDVRESAVPDASASVPTSAANAAAQAASDVQP
jgi:lipoyl(octanoyl) transferase